MTGPLTSGMVGLPVTIEYDEAWDGLTNNLVCRCSPWGSDDGEVRTILNVGEAAVVAHEVMQAGQYLHLGIEGFREDGTLVMPTTWARCGRIEYGANADGDPSADPELPIWGQLQAQIGQLDRDGIPQETLDEVLRCAEAAVQAQKAAEAAAERAEAAADPGGYGALVAAQIDALDGMFQVGAYDADSGYAAAYAAFRSAFGLTVPDGGGSGEGDSGGSDESGWTAGVAYVWENVMGAYVDNNNGSFVAYDGWSRTPYLACAGAEILRAEVVEQSSSMSRSNSSYNAFYDAERRFISAFTSVDTDAPAVGAYTDIAVPANAAFFVVSHKDNVMGATGYGMPYIRFIPYSEVPV